VSGADPDFFFRSFKKYAQDKSFYQRYPVAQFKSFEDMGKHGSYDVIVFGTSVANMGWAEIMRQDFGMRICNAWPFLNQFNSRNAGGKILDNYNKINDHKKALLLYCNFTETWELNLEMLDDVKEPERMVEPREAAASTFFTPLSRVIRRADWWIHVLRWPQVVVINLNGDDEVFFISDLASLTAKREYDKYAYSKLVRQLKHFKERAAEHNCRFAIAAFPNKAQQYEWLLLETGKIKSISPRINTQTLKKAAQECDIPFLDIEEKLTPIAKEVYAKERALLWWRDDTHVNGLGAKYIAGIIKEFIDSLDKYYVQKNQGVQYEFR